MYAGQDVKKINHAPPAAIVNAGSVALLTPGYIDTLGFSSVFFEIELGATDIALTALKVQEADDHSTWVDVPGADFSVLPLTLPSATDDNKQYGILIPVNGLRQRYMKLIATFGSGSSGGYLTAQARLGNPANAPYDGPTQGYAQYAKVAG